MYWEHMRYESDRAVREGELTRDRHAARHVRELELTSEPTRVVQVTTKHRSWKLRIPLSALRTRPVL